jgi:mitochondrial-processing peptidase subunit beta
MIRTDIFRQDITYGCGLLFSFCSYHIVHVQYPPPSPSHIHTFAHTAGSRYETAENNGAAHFLEHLAFKGTKRRSQTGLEVEIENMGAHLNAYTSREQTVYFAKCFKQDIEKSMDILSDILLHSELARGSVERERSVIVREMEEVSMQYEEVIMDHLHEAAYSASGLGMTILGPEVNINTLKQQQVIYIYIYMIVDNNNNV